MSPRLSRTDEGTLLPVRVTPRASRTQIDGELDGAVRIKLNAPPVDGAANKALCEFLASHLKCKKRDVSIVRGEKSREKSVLIRGMEPDEVLLKLGSGA